MLSTAHRVLDGDVAADEIGCIKKTHQNHPSAVWTRESSQHYSWLQQMTLALSEAYTERTGKLHAYAHLIVRLEQKPAVLDDRGFQEPPIAAPDEFKAMHKTHGTCGAYQHYLNSKYKEWLTRPPEMRKMRVEWTFDRPKWAKFYS